MGQVYVPEIVRFPNDDGLLFNHVWRNRLRDGSGNAIGIKRNPQTTICPVQGIDMWATEQLELDLTQGYLFRPTTTQGAMLDAPFSSSSAEASLKVYLQQMWCDSGETFHGFRAGCAITLTLSGAELSENMDHVGWSRRHTALYYLPLAKVLIPTRASGMLAAANVPSVTSEWEDLNNLRRFVCAFPADTSTKRPRRDLLFS